MILQFLLNGLVIGCVYALVATGYALVYNTVRVFHVAYAALYVFAAYMMYSFYVRLGLSFVVSASASVSLTILLSVLFEWVVYRPLFRRGVQPIVTLISSIGGMVIVVNTIALFYGSETKVLSVEVSRLIDLGFIAITGNQCLQLGTSIAFLLLFFVFLQFTGFGVKTRALRDDPLLFVVFGADLNLLRTLLFALSGVFVAAGAVVVGYDVGMDPYGGMSMLLNAFIALIVGGIGRFESPVVGGILLGLLQSIVMWALSAQWQDMASFVVLIVFLLFRPQGILGETERMV